MLALQLSFQQETSCREHAEGWLTDRIRNFEACCNMGKVAVRQSLNISFIGASDFQSLDYTVDMDRLIYTAVVQCSNEGTIGKPKGVLDVIWQVWHSTADISILVLAILMSAEDAPPAVFDRRSHSFFM